MSENGQTPPQLSGRTEDRRSLRTKNALWTALLGLLQQENWDDITIGTICRDADVARSSFYAHFENKGELLAYGFEHAGPDRAALARHGAGGGYAILEWLTEHTFENAGFMQRAMESTSGQAILRRFQAAISERLVAEAAEQGKTMTPEEARFITGGTFSVLHANIATGRRAATASALRDLALRVV
ncbi:MAG: TetR family transcriptional regulator [Notoacmeibacter sp.]|nr:TetR family transcriptional regulator [Notoacmeibacter sp.]